MEGSNNLNHRENVADNGSIPRNISRRTLISALLGAATLAVVERKTPFDVNRAGVSYDNKEVGSIIRDEIYKVPFQLETQAMEALLAPGDGMIRLLQNITENSGEAMTGIGNAIAAIEDLVTHNENWVEPVVEKVVFLDSALRQMIKLIESGEQAFDRGIGPFNAVNVKKVIEHIPPLESFVDIWGQIVTEGKNKLYRAAEHIDSLETEIVSKGSGLFNRVGQLTTKAIDPLRRSSLFWGNFLTDAGNVLEEFKTAFDNASRLHEQAQQLVKNGQSNIE